MIQISIEIHRGTIPIKVLVWADSIKQALELASTQYPGSRIEVSFPINPEQFFVKHEGAEELLWPEDIGAADQYDSPEQQDRSLAQPVGVEGGESE